MQELQHWGIFVSNEEPVGDFVRTLLLHPELLGDFKVLSGLKGAWFSESAIEEFLEEEARHEVKVLTAETEQSLRSHSSGERKKALLRHLMAQNPGYIILDSPFDNLDSQSKHDLHHKLKVMADKVHMVQLVNRKDDLLPFINRYGTIKSGKFESHPSLETAVIEERAVHFSGQIPKPLTEISYDGDYLVRMQKVRVAYGQKVVLNGIDWDIRPGEFWQLRGKNGSGKTTLLSLIIGDNPKAYGQDIRIFGWKKGSGESVWDIKEHLGYFTPAMTDRFRGYHSLENMLISGLTDSIGLYVRPTDAQIELANKWLDLLDLKDQGRLYFHELTAGQKRLLMVARAMIKHPLLLILDEPTAGLDDHNANLVTALTNKMAEESKISIVFVSHREEEQLKPEYILHLRMTPDGSAGDLISDHAK